MDARLGACTVTVPTILRPLGERAVMIGRRVGRTLWVPKLRSVRSEPADLQAERNKRTHTPPDELAACLATHPVFQRTV
jgi:hypothetical protein